MLRLVRRPRGLIPLLGALLVALSGVAASASAQSTFTVTVRASAPGFGHATVTSDPEGINCDFQGSDFDINGKGTCTASFHAGSSVVLSVATRDGTTHTGWGGDCGAFTGACTLLVDQNRTATVGLKPAFHTVSIVLTGNGTGSLVEVSNFSATKQLDCVIIRGQVSGTCEADYPFGSRVNLEFKTPLNGATRFNGYPIPPCTDGGLCRALVTGPITINAAFTAPELHIRGTGTGSGRVVGTASSSTLDCFVGPSGTTGRCDGVFDTTPAPQMSFTATAGGGSVFVGWSGLCSGAGACSVLAAEPPNTELVAQFDLVREGVVSLSVNSSGGFGRGRVTSSPPGIDCDFGNPASVDGTGTCTAEFAVGTTVQLKATPRDGTKVIGFTGDCASGSDSCTVVMFHDRRATVQLDPARVPVTIVGSPGNGSGRVNAVGAINAPLLNCTLTRGDAAPTGCTTMYPLGATVRLVAGTFGSSKFIGFAVPPCVSSSDCMVTVTGPLTIPAAFVAPAINIVGSGTGTGRVQANGIDGLDCTVSPSGSTGTCSRVSDFSTATTLSFLTIVPAPGSVFVGWSGLCTGNGGCTTTGDFPPNTQLVARFDLETTPPTLRTLIVSGAGKGSGAVQSSPAGIACTITNGLAPEGHGCSADFAQDQLVTLNAATSFPNRFVGWIGPCDGTGPCVVKMSQSVNVAARFEPDNDAVALTIVGGGSGNGVVNISPGSIPCPISGGAVQGNCVVVFATPSQVVLTANPVLGSTFGGWSGEGCTTTELQCVFTLSSSRTIVATFISPHTSHDLSQALTGASTLRADERAALDRLGNNNGIFDIGDLLAYLDRTGQKLTPPDAAAQKAGPPTPPAARTPRRNP